MNEIGKFLSVHLEQQKKRDDRAAEGDEADAHEVRTLRSEEERHEEAGEGSDDDGVGERQIKSGAKHEP